MLRNDYEPKLAEKISSFHKVCPRNIHPISVTMDTGDPPGSSGLGDIPIRIKVNLDDLSLWESQFPDDESEDLSPRSTNTLQRARGSAIRGKLHSHSTLHDEREVLMDKICTRLGTRGRPRLVNSDDFKNSLVQVAQSIITSRQSAHAEIERRSVSPVSEPRREVPLKPHLNGLSPLIKAFQTALKENDTIVAEIAEVPPLPLLPPSSLIPGKVLPIPAKVDTSILTDIDVHTAVQSPQLEIQNFLEIQERKKSPPPIHVDLSPRSQLRSLRILERASSRKIWSCWKRYRAKRKPDDEFKKMLKSMVENTLSNSRLIRDELVNLRDHLSHSPGLKFDASCMSDGSSVPLPKSDRIPIYRSARVLIAPNVQSPVMMDRLLDDVTSGVGRNAVRLCTAQQSLHPKAFVIVTSMPGVSVEEWKSRIMNCYYIYAWDQAFPFFQTPKNGIPWEVSVRNDMECLSPDWVATGAHVVYNSSPG